MEYSTELYAKKQFYAFEKFLDASLPFADVTARPAIYRQLAHRKLQQTENVTCALS